MAQPVEKQPAHGEISVDLRGHRVMRRPCQHCDQPVIVDLGPVVINIGGGMDSLLDSLLESLAAQIVCCDQCAAAYTARERTAQLHQQAQQMIQRRDVLPGFGRHLLERSDPALEMANRPAWIAAREWIASGITKSVLVYGAGDSGKTHLCRTMAMEAWRAGRTILEVTGWDLFNGSLLYPSEDVVAKTTRMRRAAVLYVQGIDRGEPKGKHLGLLLEIMEERHARRLITIMESQLAPVQVAQRWQQLTGDPGIGGDIFSRLHPVVKLEMQRPRNEGREVGMRQLEAERGTT